VSNPISVADFMARELEALGVEHVFGVGGANIEDLFAAIQRRRPALRAVLTKHEHGAGTAADAYARIGRRLGVVIATSGGGTLNLVQALGEARASGVPLLAIVGEPPSELQGRGAFQDSSAQSGAVDAAVTLGSVAKYAARVEDPRDAPRLLSLAVAAATAEPPGPAVLLIAKDRQLATLDSAASLEVLRRKDARRPDAERIGQAAALLPNGRSMIIAGPDVMQADASGELRRLALVLRAPVAVTPDARDAFDNRDALFAGVAGSMGHPAVAQVLTDSECVLVVGTRLPLLARQSLESMLRERTLVSVGRGEPFLRGSKSVHVEGELRAVLAALGDELERLRGRATVKGSRLRTPDAPEPEAPARLDTRTAVSIIERQLPEQSVILVDAGNTGASVAHGLSVPPGGRWLMAMGMGGMGWTFGASLGAALVSGRRTVVLAGDGAFFMHGLEIHTALEHRLPITFVVFNNRAHGMCLVREDVLLGGRSGYNSFGSAHLGAGLGAMFPGLTASDCRTAGELRRALAGAFSAKGPSVIAIELEAVEVPPFTAFQAAGRPAFSVVERGERP